MKQLEAIPVFNSGTVNKLITFVSNFLYSVQLFAKLDIELNNLARKGQTYHVIQSTNYRHTLTETLIQPTLLENLLNFQKCCDLF